ncbi:MAG: hypothetical protein J6T33_11090, partial [Bacteroidales bacterium]|nr:hypothetical protein [Bacteroidales bacterium]
ENQVRSNIFPLLVWTFGLFGGWSAEIPDIGRLFRVVRIGRSGAMAIGHTSDIGRLHIYKRKK